MIADDLAFNILNYSYQAIVRSSFRPVIKKCIAFPDWQTYNFKFRITHQRVVSSCQRAVSLVSLHISAEFFPLKKMPGTETEMNFVQIFKNKQYMCFLKYCKHVKFSFCFCLYPCVPYLTPDSSTKYSTRLNSKLDFKEFV